MHENIPVKPKTTLRYKVILVIGGVLCCIICLEISLRLSGFIFSYLQEYRNTISLKHKGAYRIMCLGESTTAGGQEAYPAQLEEVLNQRNIGIKFSVINKGVVATNTSRILRELEGNIDTYKPVMVIAMMGENDRSIKYFEGIPYDHSILFNKFMVYRLARILCKHAVNKSRKMGSCTAVSNNQATERLSQDAPNGKIKERIKSIIRQEQMLNKAIEITARDDMVYFNLGQYYRRERRCEESGEMFNKAVELNPLNYNAYIALGRYYNYWQAFIQAEESFKKAIALDPKNEMTYIELGMFYVLLGKHSQAEDALKKSIEINPRNYIAYAGLGQVYKPQGKYLQAEKMYKKSIELNPGNGLVYIGLGKCYELQNKYAEAEKMYEKAIKINSENERAYRCLATLYAKMRKDAQSYEYTEKADKLRIESTTPLTRHNYQELRRVLIKRGTRLVCVQYPMRSIGPLKMIFEDQQGVILVDNEKIFKEAVRREGYKIYFEDMFAGDFGHCTPKGNRLLAENIADVILREYFNK